MYIYINTCSIREGHITCDAVAVNSQQSSVLNDLNYTVVDVIYHSVYTLPSFNIYVYSTFFQYLCILHLLSISVYTPPSFNICVYSTFFQYLCILHLLSISVLYTFNICSIYIVSTQLSVILLHWSQFTYIHTYMCIFAYVVYISIWLVTEC